MIFVTQLLEIQFFDLSLDSRQTLTRINVYILKGDYYIVTVKVINFVSVYIN